MSEGNDQASAARKKRVQRLKKLIILILLTVIMIPCVCCAVLFVKVHRLDDTLQTMTDRLEKMENLLGEQERLLRHMQEAAAGAGSQKEESPSVTEEAPQEPEDAPGKVTEAGHKVYLTFDDGPSIYTDDILDILDSYDVKATFFVVGKEDDASREALCDIVRRGHSLGMHSYSHRYRDVYESVDSFAEDFLKLQDYLYEVTGVKSTIYRFPGGSSNTISTVDMQEFADYLEEQGVTFYDWNISSGDGGSTLLSVEDLVENSTKDITQRGTSIILLHDSAEKRTTVEALPTIIENILALEDTVILPITEDTEPVQHIHTKAKE